MDRSSEVTFFQLRYIYRMLYKKSSRDDEMPVLQRKDIISTDGSDNDPLSGLMKLPAYSRWIISAYAGMLDQYIPDDNDPADPGIPKDLLKVKSALDFVKLHFYPVYSQWKNYFGEAHKSYNLQDLMGRKPVTPEQAMAKGRNRNSDHGAGAGFRSSLLSFLREEDHRGLHLLKNTQTEILSSYRYSPVRLREAAVNFFDEVKKYEDPSGYFYSSGIFSGIKQMVMNLFSSCCDDSALTAMLIAAVLREKAEFLLSVTDSLPFMRSFSLKDPADEIRIDLGDGYYLLCKKHSNYVGGQHLTDMTLYKEPGHFIRKISDILGYFFTDPPVDDPEVNRSEMKIINYFSDVSPFRDGTALFTWEYKPDGRYWEDDTGFGGTGETRVILYSLMTASGRFIIPFRRTKPAQPGTVPLNPGDCPGTGLYPG